ncbi:MAG: class I SAM-dependent methyltransferase [Acidobacteria bacterium]|nr:class I SAM-dependent methyltransferase [Acidobacteriota bacterium]
MDKDLNIKQYWDERAAQNVGRTSATTDDIYLRKIEIATFIDRMSQLDLPELKSVLDVGCGDGYSTIQIAQKFPEVQFLGLDYSEQMISLAQANIENTAELKDRVLFKVGNAMDIDQTCDAELFDVVISDRCLINLDSVAAQSRAIAQIAKHTKPGGYYLAVENFVEGQENLTAARQSVGLKEIPIRWHNLYFKETEFVGLAEEFFERISFLDFSSSYYFATRVIYSAMCEMRGETPDYNHEIHQVAVKLPWVGKFSPIRMTIMQRHNQFDF